MEEVPVLVHRDSPTRGSFERWPAWRSVWLLLVVSLAQSSSNAGVALAAAKSPIQSPAASTSTSSPSPSNPLALSPRSWVVEAAVNELTALHHPGSYLRYRMHVHDEKGNQVRDVIESKDGTVARLVMKDDRPLTEAEDKAERDRLHAMIASPSDYFKHVRNEESGRKIADALIRLMPDAMIYTYTPDQPQSGTNHGELEIVMDYEPNRNWKPPTTTSGALTGLKGRMWIDAKTRQLVRMEGTIFQGVNFGWGMIAHVYPGGKLVLEQTNAGEQRWIFTHFTEQVAVRALMVKTVNIHANVDAEGFQTLPGPISYQDAIRMLLSTPLTAH
jgi:hypothetical protein